MFDASLIGFGLIAAAALAVCVVAARRAFLRQSREIAGAKRSSRATFELAGVGHVHVDLDGRWIRVNDRFCEMTGYRREELLAMTSAQITHPDDIPRLVATLEDMRSGADYTETEKRYLRKDGSILWANATGSLVRDAAGRPDFLVGIIVDVGPRKDAEAQLIAGGAQYRAIFEGAVEAMAVIDAKGIVQSVNPSVERIFGYAPRELIGRNIKMLMPRAVAALHDGFLQHYRDTGEKAVIGIGREVIGKRKDGTQFPLDISVSEWECDGTAFFTGSMCDISARKQAEAALAASEAHFAAIYAQPGAGVAETDLLCRFVSANDRYCEIVGRSREELLKLTMKDIVHPDNLQGALFERLVAVGKPFTLEKRYLKPDGSIACVMSTSSPLTPEGSAATIVLVAIDVTERKEAEAALDASEESLRLLQNEFAHMSRVNDLGEMAAAIAHEINQPLTAIANYLNTGLFAVVDGHSEERFAELGQIMRQASEQALRAGDIVRRLREFVGQGDGARSPERAEKLVDVAMALALMDARSSGISIERIPGAGDAMVEVDAIQIQQVLVNLLRNAVDAMNSAPGKSVPRLTISTREAEDGSVEFSVADNGPGIAPALAGRIFEPFMTTKAKGMGMGLSVCRRLIASHGGTIDVASEPGTGATFTVRLPRYRSISG